MLDIDKFLPEIDRVNFEAIRVLDGADFPGTYDEWLNLLAKQRIDRVQKGHRPESVQINTTEFVAYCRRVGKAPTMERLYHLAVEKGFGHS